MAINSAGYEGSITETEWAKLAGMIGTRFAAAGYADWRPTIVTGADRTIRFAPGLLYGDGVLDENTANINNATAPVVSSGTRWDTYVARRDWTLSGGGATTVVRLGGTSTQALATLQDTPGTIADQPLALAEFVAGQQTARTLIDLRTFPGKVMTAESLLTADLHPLGTEIIVGGARYRRTRNGSNVETQAVDPQMASGLTTASFVNANVTSRTFTVTFPAGVFRSTPRVIPALQTSSGNSGVINVRVTDTTTTGFTYDVYRNDGGGNVPATTYPVAWIAVAN